MVEVFCIIMEFSNSLSKEYYYSLEEALNKEPHKKSLWESLEEYFKDFKQRLFDDYDITELFVINEIFEKNDISNKVSLLIKIDPIDFDQIYEDRNSLFDNMDSVNYFLSTPNFIFDVNNNKKVDLNINKTWKLKT